MNPTIKQSDIIRGGEKIKVFLSPEEPDKEILVRQIKAKEIERFLELEQEGELRPLEMVTGLNLEQLEDLNIEDVEKIQEANERQNFSFIRKREIRDLQKTAQQIKALKEIDATLYQEAISKVRTAMDSAISSVTPSQPQRFPGSRRPRA